MSSGIISTGDRLECSDRYHCDGYGGYGYGDDGGYSDDDGDGSASAADDGLGSAHGGCDGGDGEPAR
jgi:hypothetical protein